jgi:hypothetical protein
MRLTNIAAILNWLRERERNIKQLSRLDMCIVIRRFQFMSVDIANRNPQQVESFRAWQTGLRSELSISSSARQDKNQRKLIKTSPKGKEKRFFEKVRILCFEVFDRHKGH